MKKMNYIDPNDFSGSDIEKINSAIAAAGNGGTVRISKRQCAGDSREHWLIDSAILVPGNITLIVSDCKIKLSDLCRDNFIRSANTLDPALPRINNVCITGEGDAVLEGADNPRSTGDAAKFLGDRTYGSDAGKPGETPNGDWRNIGILLVKVSDFVLSKLKIVNSHSWATSLEYCTDGRVCDMEFYSRNIIMVNGKPERTLNKDGLDLRRGCRNIEIENISGSTGDDLVALTAIPTSIRPAGQFGEHEFTGSSEDIADDDLYNVNIKNVVGWSQCNIVRFLNASGVKLHHITLDGLRDTSTAEFRSGTAVRVGDTVAAWGGVAPVGDTHDIKVSNVTSYAKTALFIGGSLTDSGFTNVTNHNPDAETVFYKSGVEYTKNLTFENVRKA